MRVYFRLLYVLVTVPAPLNAQAQYNSLPNDSTSCRLSSRKL